MMLGILVIDHLDEHSRPSATYRSGETDLAGTELISAIAGALFEIARADDYRMGFLRYELLSAEGFTSRVDMRGIDTLAVVEVWHGYNHADLTWTMDMTIRLDGEAQSFSIVGGMHR